MTFELTPYQENILAELHDAWKHLSERVIQLENEKARKQLLPHSKHCLQYNSVRHLPAMQSTLHLIHLIAYQQQVDGELYHNIENIRLLMNEFLTTINSLLLG